MLEEPVIVQDQDHTKLCYVHAELDGQSVTSLVGSGATHNFIKEVVTGRLKLHLEPGHTSFKVVDLEVEKVVGVPNRVPLRLGDWSGDPMFLVVPMDDFEVALGQDF
jgi:hypothetical protein